MNRRLWALIIYGAVVCFFVYWPLTALGLRFPWVTFMQIIIGFVAMLIAARVDDYIQKGRR